MTARKKGKRLNGYRQDYVVFDLETTGINQNYDEIIEISAVKVCGGEVVGEYSTLVNPGRHIPAGATAVNGITDEMVKEAGISKGLLFHYFTSKAGLYEFICDYSVKFVIMEMSSTVGKEEKDYFRLRLQIEKAKMTAMKNFPYIQLFLLQMEKETSKEALEVMQPAAQALRSAYDDIYQKADFGMLEEISVERLAKIVDYTLNGLLEELLRKSSFSPDTYYAEVSQYLKELERMCRY